MKRSLVLLFFLISGLFTHKTETINYNLIYKSLEKVGETALAGLLFGAAGASTYSLIAHGSKTYQTPEEIKRYNEIRKKEVIPVFLLSFIVGAVANYKYSIFK